MKGPAPGHEGNGHTGEKATGGTSGHAGASEPAKAETNDTAGPSRWWRRGGRANGSDGHTAAAAAGDTGGPNHERRARFHDAEPRNTSTSTSYMQRARAAAGRLHGYVMAHAAMSSVDAESSRRPSASTIGGGPSFGSWGDGKHRSPYARANADDVTSTWASRDGAPPASVSEADLVISARRGDREYRWRSLDRAGGGGDGSCPIRAASRRRRPGLPRLESGGGTSTSDSDLAPGPINCIVVDQDLTAFMVSDTPEYDYDDAIGGEKTHRGRIEDKEKGDDDRGADNMIASADIDLEKGGGGAGAPSSPSYPDLSGAGSRSPRCSKLAWLRTRWHEQVVTPLKNFADLSFDDAAEERAFQKEQWYASRPGALLACAYIVALYIGTLACQQLWTTFHKYAYLGVCTFFTLPVAVLVFFNMPLKKVWFYQLALLGAAWVWAFVFVVEMRRCSFFNPQQVNCYQRKYLDLFATVQGLPALALIALRQNRVLHIAMATIWLVTTIGLFQNETGVPTIFWRNVVTSHLFNLFCAGMSYFRERADRQIFSLRAQLKDQYRAVQSAQAMERRAEQSKKRFVSYIFHEVRVPLNTARLALANLDGESAFRDMSDDHKDLILGLDGSLKMMEQVLNDVLSFNRMESGNLTLARKPFSFHRAVQYVGLAHRSTAEVAGLDFELDLDPRIDALGGVVLGDEMRFKQICSNLISNGFKFTHKGGIRLVTKLLYPQLPEAGVSKIEQIAEHGDDVDRISEDKDAEERKFKRLDSGVVEELREVASCTSGPEGDGNNMPRNPRGRSGSRTMRSVTPATTVVASSAGSSPARKIGKAIIRVEVHDTGVGLSLSDVRDNRLFSPYVQTEIGRRQGGKGSGLGLALVTQIVRLSGGRLGVDSEPGKGSVFWFELPYTVPPIEEKDLAPPDDDTLVPSFLMGRRTSSAQSVLSGGGGRRDSAATSVGERRAFSPPAGNSGMPHSKANPPRLPLVGHFAHASSAVPVPLVSAMSATSMPPITPTTPTTRTPTSESPQSAIPLLRSDDWPAEEVAPDTPLYVPSALTPPPIDSLPQTSAASEPAIGTAPPSRSAPGWPVTYAPAPTASSSSSSSLTTTTVLPSSPGPPSTLVASVLPPSPGAHPIVATAPEAPLNALVVDDDALTRKLMARMLKRLGHNVQQAEDGRSALRMITESWSGLGPSESGSPKFDIVFLDNQMPLMFGVEVAREVRARGIPVYIVGCTGNALREDQDEYLAAGADGVLPKPVHEAAIREQLRQARLRARGKRVGVRVGGVRVEQEQEQEREEEDERGQARAEG